MSILRQDLILLFRILVGHIVTAYVISRIFRLKRKKGELRNFPKRCLQSFVYGIFIYLFTTSWHSIWLLVVISVGHFIISSFIKKSKENPSSFVLEQMSYLMVLVICWFILIKIPFSNLIDLTDAPFSNLDFWVLLFSYLFVFFPGGTFIGSFTSKWRIKSQSGSDDNLESAGLWIGRIERLLILTFVMLDYFEAIGFLIAAKSIFRFDVIKGTNNGDRSTAEYILIGTLLSFTLAIAVGLLAKWVLK